MMAVSQMGEGCSAVAVVATEAAMMTGWKIMTIRRITATAESRELRVVSMAEATMTKTIMSRRAVRVARAVRHVAVVAMMMITAATMNLGVRAGASPASASDIRLL